MLLLAAMVFPILVIKYQVAYTTFSTDVNPPKLAVILQIRREAGM